MMLADLEWHTKNGVAALWDICKPIKTPDGKFISVERGNGSYAGKYNVYLDHVDWTIPGNDEAKWIKEWSELDALTAQALLCKYTSENADEVL
jgi:hypothetical protein